ncbi:ATP-dependent DNA helicase RecG [Propylenella binzhouense]|uniref:ATP-dependent DNA helicase RecG n=1 Tax=Propylenella binzhouense TaxID=2555902 RepID=A0A964WSZ6_9HYPH|nr:ATP-dependent DNA helicase RecG [Propylenella binzhouense]MYZ47315.1 ATP-dependent DNA helicase RecG [Propylenella binzhouense]
MRPSLLDPLFAPASVIPGVGPRVAALLGRFLGDGGEPIVRDVLFHLPHAVIDRRVRPPLWALPQSGTVTVEGVVERHEPPPVGSRAPWRVILAEGGAAVQVVYFHARADWMLKLFPVGARRIVSGAVEWFDLRPQISHPDYVLAPERAGDLPALEPVYGGTAGLSPKVLRKAIVAALARLPELPEWIPADLRAREHWPSFSDALRQVHEPAEPADADPKGPAWRRLAFDEMLASQLALGLVRASARRVRGEAWRPAGAVAAALRAALPFAPTSSQEQAIAEISADLGSETRMIRLLQGDVGSGKTLVALFAMAAVAEAGGQAALMAPTELLARQHFATMAPLAEAAGLEIRLLTGKDKPAERAEAIAAIAAGRTRLVVGTHALFQGEVAFKRLGLAVVDEQHRFGVHQRLALSAKGMNPDLLVMTATPIPRTLVLSWFGDMDVSRLTEKPAGRRPIDTRLVSLDRLPELVARIGGALAAGEKAYWVCPLVSESEQSDLAAAEERHAALRRTFGEKAVLVHGRMSAAAKEAAMERFRSGNGMVLVATTVIEVGVDVPDATIIVIEHAERFGLAQLHQLRGRVGRGAARSSCILLYRGPLGETARARLEIMRETEDGFRIAEEDLRLRGEGDLLGTRQSGVPGFRIARADLHAELLPVARDAARLILSHGPQLEGERAEALKLLLYLFGRDDAVRLMRSG